MSFGESRLVAEGIYQETLRDIDAAVSAEMVHYNIVGGFAGFMLYTEAESQKVYPIYWIGNYQLGYIDLNQLPQPISLHNVNDNLVLASPHQGFSIATGLFMSQLNDESLCISGSGIREGYSAVLVNTQFFCPSEMPKEHSLRAELDRIYHENMDTNEPIDPVSFIEITLEEDDIDSRNDFTGALLRALSCYNRQYE